MRLPAILALATLLLAGGCGLPQSAEEIQSTPEARYLRDNVDKLAAHDYAAIESRMDERVNQPDMRQALEHLASLLPEGAPSKLEPIAWNHIRVVGAAKDAAGSRTANVAIEYTFPGARWVVASATLSGEPDHLRILAFNVEPIAAPLAQLNALTLDGKGPLHYLFPLLPLAALGVSVFAFVCCLRTPGLKRKWLWAIFTLIGLVNISLNWSNGAVSIQPLQFQLFSASVIRLGWVGPWVISCSIPVGALLFLWKYGIPRRPRLLVP